MTDRRRPEPIDQPCQGSPVPWSYEVHIEGQLGGALLRYLRWPSRTQPEQSIIRLRATSEELQQLLLSCSDCGLIVERVTRIDSFSGEAPADDG